MAEALGQREFDRMVEEVKLYERYDGELNVWSDYEKPGEIDYEPTTLTMGYLRKHIDTIAAWQFEKEPKVTVPPEIVDDPSLMLTGDYSPSDNQQAENSRASAKERLLTQIWDENRMHEKLLKGAKDRSISKTGVYVRLHFDVRRGALRYIFHPSTEVIAIHNEWDADELDEVHFVAYLDAEKTKLWKLSYYLTWHGDDEGNGHYDCEIEEAVYDEEFDVIDERVERKSMGLDFIPVVHVPTDSLTGQTEGYSELEKLITVVDEIDRKLSDYSDALRFEMFAIVLLMNVEEDPKNPLKISPAAKWNLGDTGDEKNTPDAKRLESGFKFRESIENYLDRMYEALHEISEVPIVNTAEMKTGGINDMALKLLFSSIISKTQRAWVTWQSRLQTLNEYTLRYLQARREHGNFKYDEELVDLIEDNYSSEIIFGLPLPQDQQALVAQLGDEIASQIESIKGAITRSGKENAEAKLMEIIEERDLMRRRQDPYGEE